MFCLLDFGQNINISNSHYYSISVTNKCASELFPEYQPTFFFSHFFFIAEKVQHVCLPVNYQTFLQHLNCGMLPAQF